MGVRWLKWRPDQKGNNSQAVVVMKYRSRALKISSDKEHNGFGGSEAQDKPEFSDSSLEGLTGWGWGRMRSEWCLYRSCSHLINASQREKWLVSKEEDMITEMPASAPTDEKTLEAKKKKDVFSKKTSCLFSTTCRHNGLLCTVLYVRSF